MEKQNGVQTDGNTTSRLKTPLSFGSVAVYHAIVKHGYIVF
jgi:hypothetical protein